MPVKNADSKKTAKLRPLKKIAAILLIGILFFNWYGYQLLSAYWQQLADRQLEADFDNDQFDASGLISIKLAVNDLAYHNSSLGFERVDGQCTIGDIAYKYVMRRFFKDSLELLCIPDLAAIQLRDASNEFFRQVNDLSLQKGRGSLPNHDASHAKGLQKEYAPEGMNYGLPWIIGYSRVSNSVFISPILADLYIPTAERPPDAPLIRLPLTGAFPRS
jgi:hypothetical protein